MSYVILAYHPTIVVDSTTITGELNDYYSDDEILDEIRKHYDVKDYRDVVTLLPLKLDSIGQLYLADDNQSSCQNNLPS